MTNNRLNKKELKIIIDDNYNLINNNNNINTLNSITKIQDNLFLGNYNDAKNIKTLLDNNIKVIINVSEDIPSVFKEYRDNNDNYIFLYYRIPIKDSIVDIKKYFYKIYDIIDVNVNNNIPVFVHCYAGISRSPTIIISYLMKKYNLSLDKAISFVKDKRNIIDPNIYFYSQLHSYEIELNSNKNNDNNANNN